MKLLIHSQTVCVCVCVWPPALTQGQVEEVVCRELHPPRLSIAAKPPLPLFKTLFSCLSLWSSSALPPSLISPRLQTDFTTPATSVDYPNSAAAQTFTLRGRPHALFSHVLHRFGRPSTQILKTHFFENGSQGGTIRKCSPPVFVWTANLSIFHTFQNDDAIAPPLHLQPSTTEPRDVP